MILGLVTTKLGVAEELTLAISKLPDNKFEMYEEKAKKLVSELIDIFEEKQIENATAALAACMLVVAYNASLFESEEDGPK